MESADSKNKIGYSLKNLTVVQAQIGKYLHKGFVKSFARYYEKEIYPIFVSTMPQCQMKNNYQKLIENKLIPVVYGKIASIMLQKSGWSKWIISSK